MALKYLRSFFNFNYVFNACVGWRWLAMVGSLSAVSVLLVLARRSSNRSSQTTAGYWTSLRFKRGRGSGSVESGVGVVCMKRELGIV